MVATTLPPSIARLHPGHFRLSASTYLYRSDEELWDLLVNGKGIGLCNIRVAGEGEDTDLYAYSGVMQPEGNHGYPDGANAGYESIAALTISQIPQYSVAVKYTVNACSSLRKLVSRKPICTTAALLLAGGVGVGSDPCTTYCTFRYPPCFISMKRGPIRYVFRHLFPL